MPSPRKVFHSGLVLASLLVLLPGRTVSQVFGTGSHTITVTVQPITVLQVSAGIVNLSITGSNAIAGQDQMTITDQSSSLLWGTNSSLRKITVSTSLSVPLYTLQVAAEAPTAGTAGTQITLSTTANDLVTNIGRSSGACGLLYTGIALASQGTGTDSHTITFTIQAQ